MGWTRVGVLEGKYENDICFYVLVSNTNLYMDWGILYTYICVWVNVFVNVRVCRCLCARAHVWACAWDGCIKNKTRLSRLN